MTLCLGSPDDDEEEENQEGQGNGARLNQIVPAGNRRKKSFDTLSTKLMDLCIPKIKYGEEDSDRFNLERCTICMESYQEGDDLRRVVKCNHSFHEKCFEIWLKKKEVIFFWNHFFQIFIRDKFN